MRVLLARSGSKGSSYYRIDEPARAVREAGLGVDVVVRHGLVHRPCTAARRRRPPGRGGGRRGCRRGRPAAAEDRGDVAVIRLLQAQGVAVVVEMDDLLTGVPFGHMAHRVLVRGGKGDMAHQCAREADLVTVTSTPRWRVPGARTGRGRPQRDPGGG